MNQTPTIDTATLITLAENSIKDVDRFVKRCRTWHAKCDRLSAATEGTAEWAAAYAAWSKSRGGPSKNAKYRAYDAANHVARCLRPAVSAVYPHASTVDDLAALVTQARQDIAAARG